MANQPRALTRQRPMSERIIETLLFLAAVLGVATTIGIVVVLVFETWEFFQQVNPVDFLTGTTWSASIKPYAFGVLALISGTLLVAADRDDRRHPARPAQRRSCSPSTPRPASATSSSRCSRRSPASRPSCSASSRSTSWRRTSSSRSSARANIGVVLGALGRDHGRHPRHAAHRLDLRGLDASRPARHCARAPTRWARPSSRSSARSSFPAALSGIMASIILAMSRAIGETMIVVLAVGTQAAAQLRPARERPDDDRVHRPDQPRRHAPGLASSSCRCSRSAMVLFVMTFVLNLLSAWFVRRYRTAY